MSKRINVTAALVFYDGVQVFDATDDIGGKYLGVLVDGAPESDCRYVVVGVSPENLRAFRLGQVDLRSLMEGRPETDWFTADVEVDLNSSLPLRPHSEAIPEAYLPEPGYLLLDETPAAEAAVVHSEVLARQRLVMELTLNPPESASEHLIRANKLGGLLLHLQLLIRHAYAKCTEAMSGSVKKTIDRVNAPLLDVAVPMMPGSFRLILVASQYPDLFGGVELGRALSVVDDITSVANDPEETLKRLKKYQGHTVASYRRLIHFIVENDLSMRYAWSDLSRSSVSSYGITRKQAEPLLVALDSSESLGIEQVVLVGRLLSGNTTSGQWQLYVAAEKKNYSGKVREGVSLDGLILRRKTYVFTCEEVEEVTGTGRITKTLHATQIKAAS